MMLHWILTAALSLPLQEAKPRPPQAAPQGTDAPKQ